MQDNILSGLELGECLLETGFRVPSAGRWLRQRLESVLVGPRAEFGLLLQASQDALNRRRHEIENRCWLATSRHGSPAASKRQQI